MDHTPVPIHTLTGVQMDRVLLLNNACYVDSIKDTWVERAGHYSGTVGNLVRAALQIWRCHKMFSLQVLFICRSPNREKYLAAEREGGKKTCLLDIVS